jgi:hypothetical protein
LNDRRQDGCVERAEAGEEHESARAARNEIELGCVPESRLVCGKKPVFDLQGRGIRR